MSLEYHPILNAFPEDIRAILKRMVLTVDGVQVPIGPPPSLPMAPTDPNEILEKLWSYLGPTCQWFVDGTIAWGKDYSSLPFRVNALMLWYDRAEEKNRELKNENERLMDLLTHIGSQPAYAADIMRSAEWLGIKPQFWCAVDTGNPVDRVTEAHIAHLSQDLVGVYLENNVFRMGAPGNVVNLWEDGTFADISGCLDAGDRGPFPNDDALLAFLEAELQRHVANIEAGTTTVRLKRITYPEGSDHAVG